MPEISGSVELSKEQLAIFNHHKADDGSNAEQGEIPDIMDLSNLWDWAGLSFGKEEIFVVLVSLKKLVDEKPLKSVRLWGKVFGTSKNYIVVEAELKDGVVDEEDAIANPKPEVTPVSAPAEEEAAPKSPEEDETDAPKPKQKPVTSLPIEQRAGVNKYVYYVSNYGMLYFLIRAMSTLNLRQLDYIAGGAWMRLPDVIPEKLQISRQIRKYFSGDLSRQVWIIHPLKIYIHSYGIFIRL